MDFISLAIPLQLLISIHTSLVHLVVQLRGSPRGIGIFSSIQDSECYDQYVHATSNLCAISSNFDPYACVIFNTRIF